jgi:putative membrane protein
MKKSHPIPQTLIHLSFIATVLLLISCGSNTKPVDTKEVAEEHNDAKFDNNKQEKDAQFLVNAAEINLEEIQLAQLAQKRGTAKHVQELGKMMEDAHAKSQRDLIALAQSKSISIPTSPTQDAQDAYKKLNDQSGSDFDLEYADLMVKEHKDAISTFEKASTDCNDTDIKNWASSSLPDLRTHLDHSIGCKRECESQKNK